MAPEVFILLSSALSFGVPLALAVRELVLLRRHDAGGGGRNGGAARGAPPPPPRPAGIKPLPDCLIPKRLPPPAVARPRVLEDA